MRRSLILLFLAGCATTKTAEGTASCDTDTICATVQESGGLVDVHLEIPSSEPIELYFVEGVLGRGFTSASVGWIRDGEEQPWPARFTPKGGVVTIDYRVRLPPAYASDQSFDYPGGVHLKGYTFLPDFSGGPAVLRFATPEGIGLLGSPDGTPDGFFAADYRGLLRATYELGRFRSRCAKLRNIPLCVASSRATDAELEELLAMTAAILERAERLLGPIDVPAVLISDHASDSDVPVGTTVGTGITLVSRRTPSRLSEPAAFALVHELLHLWNPGPRRVPALWLREGLTEYLTYVLIRDLTDADDLLFAEWIRRAYRRYEAAYSDDTIEETSSELVYPAGAVAGFCLDLELRPAGSSTADVMKRLLAQVPQDMESTVSEDFFLAELAKVSPRSAGYFKLFISDRRFNFDGCMLRALALTSRGGASGPLRRAPAPRH